MGRGGAILLVLVTSGCVGRSALGLPEVSSDLPNEIVTGSTDACETLTSVSVYVGVQATSAATIRRFSYDLAGTLEPHSTVELPFSTTTYGTGLRGIAAHPNRLILAADVDSGDVLSPFVEAVTENFAAAAPLRLQGGGARALANVHGLCALPGGNIIAGEWRGIGRGDTYVNEYNRQGSFVRDVFTTTIDAHMLSDCVATADGTALFVVDSAQDGSRADVIRLDLASGTWTETSRFVMSDFDGGAGTGGWSVTSSGGYVYMAPTRWDEAAGRINYLIRCPENDLAAAGCNTVGAALPASLAFIESLVPLPCSDDLLVGGILGKLMRYDSVGGSLTELYDARTDSPGFIAIRKIAVVPR